MKWITRERPKIDRIACPWLIKNFVDPRAKFIFVPKDQVIEQAKVWPGMTRIAPERLVNFSGIPSF